MRLAIKPWQLALGLALVIAVPAAPATAYIPNPIRVTLSGPSGVVRCDQKVKITAKVTDNKTNKPIFLQDVTWEIVTRQSSGDRLSDKRTTTDKKGKTSVTLTFGPAARTRKIRASAAQEGDTITVRCAGGLSSGVKGVSVSVSCDSSPERLTIRNNRTSSITVKSVGSTYQPRSSEPFTVNRVLDSGTSITYTFGSGHGVNKLTGAFIFDNDAHSEAARVKTSVGTAKRFC